MAYPPYMIELPTGRRLGKRPPKLDSRTLRLARYIVKLPAPPERIDHVSRVSNWPMFLNDELGICGPAGAAHQIQSWSAYADRGTITLTDAQVKKFYYGITGGADSGVYLLDMANAWRKTGIGGDFIEAFVSVNPNLDELKLTIQHFGSAGIGLSLPDQGTFGPWDRTYGPPNPNNGHYVCAVGYDDTLRMIYVISWGTVMRMSYDFFIKYCDEAYAFLNDLMIIQASQVTPEGFNFNQLQYDLAHLGDPVTPNEPPPQPPLPPPPPPVPDTPPSIPWWVWPLAVAIGALLLFAMGKAHTHKTAVSVASEIVKLAGLVK